MTAKLPRRHVTAVGALGIAAGVALFAWIVYRVGPGIVTTGLKQIGWGYLPIVIIAGLRFVTRAAAWALCIEPPHRLRFADAFAAVVAGDALGNATPLGPIVGAAIVVIMKNVVSAYIERWNLVLGVLFVLGQDTLLPAIFAG